MSTGLATGVMVTAVPGGGGEGGEGGGPGFGAGGVGVGVGLGGGDGGDGDGDGEGLRTTVSLMERMESQCGHLGSHVPLFAIAIWWRTVQ